jgi:peptide chain release factor 3
VRSTDEATALELGKERSAEVMTRSDGVLVALFSNDWRMKALHREHPHYVLDEL